MKVKALQLGYYEHKRRREGDVFDLVEEKHFSKNWMEKVDGEEPKKSKKPDYREPQALSKVRA